MESAVVSIKYPVNRSQPIIAPTIACVVETGNPSFVIHATVRAAARATVKDPPRALIAPRCPRVLAAPAPLITAPIMTKSEAMMAAVLNLTILVATAVPKILAASFAPNDHPRKSPLVRKNQIMLHQSFHSIYGDPITYIFSFIGNLL